MILSATAYLFLQRLHLQSNLHRLQHQSYNYLTAQQLELVSKTPVDNLINIISLSTESMAILHLYEDLSLLLMDKEHIVFYKVVYSQGIHMCSELLHILHLTHQELLQHLLPSLSMGLVL